MFVFCDDHRVVFHAIIKRLVDSRLTCPVLINNWLDQALLKHLDAFHGCKLNLLICSWSSSVSIAALEHFRWKKFCNLIPHCRFGLILEEDNTQIFSSLTQVLNLLTYQLSLAIHTIRAMKFGAIKGVQSKKYMMI